MASLSAIPNYTTRGREGPFSSSLHYYDTYKLRQV